MMVAMMLPSIAPTLWRYHRAARAARAASARRGTAAFGLGYVGVWTAVSVGWYALSIELARFETTAPESAGRSRWAVIATIACAGALQCSRWKARYLARCRGDGAAAGTAGAFRTSVQTDLRRGCRLGRQCVLSCAAPTMLLIALGMTNPRVMAAVAAAITIERLAPAGARIARMTGAVALAVGLVMCIAAITNTV